MFGHRQPVQPALPRSVAAYLADSLTLEALVQGTCCALRPRSDTITVAAGLGGQGHGVPTALHCSVLRAHHLEHRTAHTR